jgi:hypothetical protein
MLNYNRPSTATLFCQQCGEAATAVVPIPTLVQFGKDVEAGSLRCECGVQLAREPKPVSMLVDAAGRPL